MINLIEERIKIQKHKLKNLKSYTNKLTSAKYFTYARYYINGRIDAIDKEIEFLIDILKENNYEQTNI